MPVPFEDSFVFNWGTYAGQPAKAVAFWYQAPPAKNEPCHELMYRISGPFKLDVFDELGPDKSLPENAWCLVWGGDEKPTQSWTKKAQRGFVDLCHMHRRYFAPVASSTGIIATDVCSVAKTSVWVEKDTASELWVGCDDGIKVFLNGKCVLSDEGRNTADPFMLSKVPVTLKAGINSLFVVVKNVTNTNWMWNGFSLVIKHDLNDEQMCHLT